MPLWPPRKAVYAALVQLCPGSPRASSEPACFASPSTDTNVFYHIEGSRQALKVVFYLDGFHFSRLPSRLEGGASLRLHTVLFTKGERPGWGTWWGRRARPLSTLGPSTYPPSPSLIALENVEGPPPPGSQAAEELQQEINAQSLEKVQQYYRKLR